VAAGVPDFIATIYRDWYDDSERAAFAAGLDELDAFCRDREGQAFHESSADTRHAALVAQQAIAESGGGAATGPFGASMPVGPDAPFFTRLKELVVLGYYTSEVGATQELVYLPVPGRFDGDLALGDASRPFTH
jgi:hypothetical protein